MEIKETCYKGTRIVLGNEKRDLINSITNELKSLGFIEINIPIINHRIYFEDKVGIDNKSMMFSVKDNNPARDLVLAPEYTSIIQKLSESTFKHQKNIKVFYVQECFRGENPQAGRYRQFTQLGIEIINPESYDFFNGYCAGLAMNILSKIGIENCDLTIGVKRGLDYYKEGKGFEITNDSLGAQKQICGGGEYVGGTGFAFGIDRLLLLKNTT